MAKDIEFLNVKIQIEGEDEVRLRAPKWEVRDNIERTIYRLRKAQNFHKSNPNFSKAVEA